MAAAAGAPAFQELPVLSHDTLIKDFEGFVSDLREACRHVGFFVLAGLPPGTAALHAELLRVAGEFFELPEFEKGLIDYRRSPQFRGYMWQGAENTGGRRDEREQIEFGSEEGAVHLGASSTAQLFERLRGPNQWPSHPPELRTVVSDWLEDMEALSRLLTRAISASLGLDALALDRLFGRPHVQAKLVHYPAIGRDGADQVDAGGLGVGAHSDSGFLTLLLQDDVGGLEVMNSAGVWVAAPPLPGSLVCNLGEVLQLLTGGAYLSTVHRVRRPGPGRGRLSAPYFWNPSLDAIVEPLPELRGDSAMPELQRGAHASNRLLPSYGMNAFKSLARSHPQAFARHHPDLECLPDGQVIAR